MARGGWSPCDVLCIDLLYVANIVVNASVRFSLNIGNRGPTVVTMIPVQYLKSLKRKLLPS